MTPEQVIINQIMTWLAVKGILHYRTKTGGAIIHTRNGIKFGREKWRHTQVGCPDIFVFKNGRTYGLEVKSSNGRVSPDQAMWLERLTREGGVGIVVRSLEEVAAALGEKI